MPTHCRRWTATADAAITSRVVPARLNYRNRKIRRREVNNTGDDSNRLKK
jgi:hypothetical protein